MRMRSEFIIDFKCLILCAYARISMCGVVRDDKYIVYRRQTIYLMVKLNTITYIHIYLSAYCDHISFLHSFFALHCTVWTILSKHSFVSFNSLIKSTYCVVTCCFARVCVCVALGLTFPLALLSSLCYMISSYCAVSNELWMPTELAIV